MLEGLRCHHYLNLDNMSEKRGGITQIENKEFFHRLLVATHIVSWYLDLFPQIKRRLDHHLIVKPILQIAIPRNSVLIMSKTLNK
jgi:hypothetical protein